MKYELEIIIDLPRDQVITLFDSSDNMAKWQPGLVNFEHISGEPGQPGAKSHLDYDMDGRKISMIETITVNNLPDEFSGTYEADSVMNWSSNKFYEEEVEKTRWVTDNEFKFSGVMRIMSIFMAATLRKQTLEHMNNFKNFAEGSAQTTDSNVSASDGETD